MSQPFPFKCLGCGEPAFEEDLCGDCMKCLKKCCYCIYDDDDYYAYDPMDEGV